ncbi:MAG: efflux RND transporter periplasmic adaptor subunit [Planctomycetota bacterium]|jgi:HlyD family secretion protein
MAIRSRKLVLPAVIVVLLVLAGYYSATRPTDVSMAVVSRGPVREFVEEEGRTRVVDRFVISAPVAGRLLRVEREAGDRVAKGDLLAEIDPLALKSKVESAEAGMAALRDRLAGVDRKRPKKEQLERSRVMEKRAQEARRVAQRRLEEAKADHEKASRDADRARSLHGEGTISASEREAAELAETRAKEHLVAQELTLKIRELELEASALETKALEESARDVDWEEGVYRDQIEGLQAQLRVLGDDLRRARLLSPADGVILERFLESERALAAGTPILSVGDLGKLEVEADILSEEAARMTPGMKVEIFGRALDDRVIPGTLSRIYPSAFKKISSLGVEQQRVTVVVAFDPSGTRLGDRYRVDVRVLFEEREDAVLVPEGALFRMNGTWRVFKVVGGRARLTELETGIRDGRVREVLKGLAEGDRVIMHPDDTFEDGMRVKSVGGE